jgi:DNA-binding beta-propeller fold protein YncE
VDDGCIHVRDKATDTVYSMTLPPAPDRLDDAPLRPVPAPGSGDWWRVRLGAERADVLSSWLDRAGPERPPVGAVAVKADRWLVAVNHPLDADRCRILVGSGTDVERVLSLDLDTARSIAGIAWGVAGDIVIVDNYLHVCRSLCASTGSIGWSFGSPRTPGSADGLLSSPSECVVGGSQILVVNEMTGVLVILDGSGHHVTTLSAENVGGLPKTPTGAVALADDHVLLTDAHSGLLHSLRRTSTGWRCLSLVTDQEPSPVGGLSFPRGLAAQGDTMFVADTANQRVAALSISRGRIVDVLQIGGWPRTLAVTQDGLLVADGLGSRLIRVQLGAEPGELVFAGAVVSVLEVSDDGRRLALADPHHLVPAGQGPCYWLVDSDLDDVLLVDTTGRVHRRWSTSAAGAAYALSDPHQVHVLEKGILVIDTNNNRILWADSLLERAELVTAALTRPRFVVPYRDGWLVSDHSGRLSVFTADWELEGHYGIRPDGSDRRVHLDDPPRGLLAHDGAIYATDWERGLVYRLA